MGRRPQSLAQFAWRRWDEPVQANVAVQQIRVDVTCDSVADVFDEGPPRVARERVPAGPSLRQHHMYTVGRSSRRTVLPRLRGTAGRVSPPVRVLAAWATTPFTSLYCWAVATRVIPGGGGTSRVGTLLLWFISRSFTLLARHRCPDTLHASLGMYALKVRARAKEAAAGTAAARPAQGRSRTDASCRRDCPRSPPDRRLPLLGPEAWHSLAASLGGTPGQEHTEKE